MAELYSRIFSEIYEIFRRIFSGIFFFEPEIHPYTFWMAPGYLPSIPKLVLYSSFLYLALSVFLSFVPIFSKNGINFREGLIGNGIINRRNKKNAAKQAKAKKFKNEFNMIKTYEKKGGKSKK